MQRLALLDYARLVAALSVVAFHYLYEGRMNGSIPLPLGPSASWAKYGYLGVELFFIISGYVIFFSARGKTAAQFVRSRALRLYPAFWCAVLLTAAALVASGERVTLTQLVANLTMVPKLLHAQPLDGVYWTLLYEIAFYAAVTAVLVAAPARLTAAFLLAPAVLLAAYAAGARIPSFGYFSFFSAGALFAILRDRRSVAALAGLAACLFLCVVGALDRAAAAEVSRGVPLSGAVVATVVCALFGMFFVVNAAHGLALLGARQAGALTYPLYLVHNQIGIALLALLPLPAVFFAVLALAWAIHAGVERRLAPAILGKNPGKKGRNSAQSSKTVSRSHNGAQPSKPL